MRLRPCWLLGKPEVEAGGRMDVLQLEPAGALPW